LVKTLTDEADELIVKLLASPTPSLGAKVLFDAGAQAMHPQNASPTRMDLPMQTSP
jgi:hypothetical protein